MHLDLGCFFGVKHSNTASYGLLCLVVLNQVPISFVPILHLQRVALNQDTNEIWNDVTNRKVNEHQLKHLSSFPIELLYVTLWITPKLCTSETFCCQWCHMLSLKPILDLLYQVSILHYLQRCFKGTVFWVDNKEQNYNAKRSMQ